jgi:hypothetical protein
MLLDALTSSLNRGIFLKSTYYELPHYSVFSNLLLLLTSVNILTSGPSSQTRCGCIVGYRVPHPTKTKKLYSLLQITLDGSEEVTDVRAGVTSKTNLATKVRRVFRAICTEAEKTSLTTGMDHSPPTHTDTNTHTHTHTQLGFSWWMDHISHFRNRF